MFLGSVKLIGYLASTVNVSSDPYVGPATRIEISLFLLSTCTNELISTLKIFPHASIYKWKF